jgi:hypothetical protein
MRGFIKADAPRPRKIADDFRSRPPGRLTEKEWLRQEIINDLSVEQRRLICAAGRLLYVGFTLHQIGRRRAAADPQAHAMSVARGILREMLRLFNAPRIKSVRALVLMFTGSKHPSVRQMQNLVKANP